MFENRDTIDAENKRDTISARASRFLLHVRDTISANMSRFLSRVKTKAINAWFGVRFKLSSAWNRLNFIDGRKNKTEKSSKNEDHVIPNIPHNNKRPVKKIIAALIALFFLVVFLDYFRVISLPRNFSFRNLIIKKETTIAISVRLPESTDKIFTHFTVIQIADINYKDALNEKNATGYCYHSYEVGFGYKEVAGVDFLSSVKLACENQDQALPIPQIISVNPVSSEAFGSFSRLQCEERNYNVELREREIRANLDRDEQLQSIIHKGQKVLGSYLRIYCKALPIIKVLK